MLSKISTLIIGDSHLPFEKKGYLKFCKKVYEEYKCSRVIHIGDLIDSHAISNYASDPNGLSPKNEILKARKRLKKWFEVFPNVYLCKGNHDKRIALKGKKDKLPNEVFKSFREIWQLPKGWIDAYEFIFDNVLYTHGEGYSGKNAHIQAAMDNRMSTVIGHLHSVSGVEYLANSKSIIFGMAVGCGIDVKKYAFEYGKGFRRKPILSCGVVAKNIAFVIPMKL